MHIRSIQSAMLVLTILLNFNSIVAKAVDIPPFYPELAAEIPDQPTNITAAQIELTLTDKQIISPADYTKTISLDAPDWRILPPVTSATQFDLDTDLTSGYHLPDYDASAWDEIKVPLDWNRQYKQLNQREQPYVRSWYRHEFNLTDADIDLSRQNIRIRFGVIGYDATVFLNGELIGSHCGDFTPCEFDLSSAVQVGQNVLAIRVLSDFGPSRGGLATARHVYGSQWSESNIKAGLWQSVELVITPKIYVKHLLVTPNLADNSVAVEYQIDNSNEQFAGVLTLAVTSAALTSANNCIGQENHPLTLAPGVNRGQLTLSLTNPARWSPATPVLYYLSAVITDAQTETQTDTQQTVTAKSVRFGFRDFKVVNGKFHLNGERLYLFGENIRSVDYGGTGRTVEQDRDRLWQALTGFKRQGVNIIRTAHLPILPVALDIADEIGLMIYNEWGWSFTHQLALPEFQDNNERELREWVERDYNHPAVVMWCGANEVVFKDRPQVKQQLEHQVKTIRQADKSGRPVGVFSGSGSWFSYGTDKLDTDFIDLHSYHGLSVSPWTVFGKTLDKLYHTTLQHYSPDTDSLPMPYIIWECVGFGWGQHLDKKFTLDDQDKYADYVRTPTTWAQPRGIGFAGTIGLSAALDPKRSNKYGQAVFGQRLLEIVRQNPKIDGLAPWHHATHFVPATLWNQPVLAGLRGSRGLPPVNFFAGQNMQLEAFVVNHTNSSLTATQVLIWAVDADENTDQLAQLSLPETSAWTTVAVPFELTFPAGTSGKRQIRVVLQDAVGTEVSRNFYNVQVGDPAAIYASIEQSKKIALLDINSSKGVLALQSIMDKLGLDYNIVTADQLTQAESLADFDLTIIAPEIAADTTSNDKTKTEESGQKIESYRELLQNWLSPGKTLLVFEQSTPKFNLIPGLTLSEFSLPFADLVMPKHPVFANLSQSYFDSWENPINNQVIRYAISPYVINSLAARGPLVGSQNVGSAIIEAKFAQGRLFWTQLDAINLWGIDSAATQYVKNIFNYLATDSADNTVKSLRELTISSGKIDPIHPGQALTIDLTPYANRGFRNDDGMGWTGQGENDFRNMPVGQQSIHGIPFTIIDPASNGGKGCLIVRGSQLPDLPASINGIVVNAKLKRMFILHTQAWGGREAGVYRFHYDDGSYHDYHLVTGRNIDDWWKCGYLPEARPAILRPNPLSPQVGIFMAEWVNPFPTKQITTFDFIAHGQTKDIDWMPGSSPVPILVAMTGELAPVKPSKNLDSTK